jgi:hypothetical protein
MPGLRKKNCCIGGTTVFAVAVCVFINASALLAAGQTAVTTYHYDNNRTGRNQNESVLTPANVGSASFGLLQKVVSRRLGGLTAAGGAGCADHCRKVSGHARCGLVATEGNTVYAIDVHSRTVLLNPNFWSTGVVSVGMREQRAECGDQLDAGDRPEQQYVVRDDLHTGSERAYGVAHAD